MSYDTTEQSYPVLYLLDPAISFLSVTEYTRWMAFIDELPEIIVVGIGYPIGSEIEARERDYHRDKNNFLDFIENELFTYVDSTFRTMSDRAIVGFSYGGEFVIHTLVDRPELFNRYIALDASSTDKLLNILISNDQDVFDKFAEHNVKFYNAQRGQELLSVAIIKKEIDGLEAMGAGLGDVTHGAALHIGLPAAISAVYSNSS